MYVQHLYTNDSSYQSFCPHTDLFFALFFPLFLQS